MDDKRGGRQHDKVNRTYSRKSRKRFRKENEQVEQDEEQIEERLLTRVRKRELEAYKAVAEQECIECYKVVRYWDNQ